jgi:hypothetical protein
MGHGLPGGVGRVPQRDPQPPGITVRGPTRSLTRGLTKRRGTTVSSGGEHLRHPPQQLRQNRPGVPTRPEQRAVRHGLHGVGQRRRPRTAPDLVPGEDRLDRGERRLHRQIQVRAGVPVGHRVDVDRVDLLTRPPQRLQRETAPGAHRESIEECLRHLRHLRLLECWTWHAA